MSHCAGTEKQGVWQRPKESTETFDWLWLHCGYDKGFATLQEAQLAEIGALRPDLMEGRLLGV